MEPIKFILNHIVVLLACLMFLGVTWFFIRKLITLSAAPTFAALYYAESIFKKFRFSIPKDGWKKLVMEICGMYTTLISIGVIYELFQAIQANNSPHTFINKMVSELSLYVSFTTCLALGIILLISHLTPKEENNELWFDKIMSLKIKSKI